MFDNFTIWLWGYEFIGKKVDNFPVWIFDNFPVWMFDNFPVSESRQFSGSPTSKSVKKCSYFDAFGSPLFIGHPVVEL